MRSADGFRRAAGAPRILLLGAGLLLTALLWPRAAAADDCRATCGDAKQTCIQAAQTAKDSCKQECRASGNAKDCRSQCIAAFHGARDTCKQALGGCKDACENQPPPSDCEVGCAATLRTCLAGVRDEGESCGKSCFAAAADAAHACRQAPAPFLCFGKVGHELGACLGACGELISTGAGDTSNRLNRRAEFRVTFDPGRHAFGSVGTTLAGQAVSEDTIALY